MMSGVSQVHPTKCYSSTPLIWTLNTYEFKFYNDLKFDFYVSKFSEKYIIL